MSIIQRIREHETRLRRLDEFNCSDMSLTEAVTGEIGRWDRASFCAQDQYELSLKATVRYWANNAERDTARDVATRCLVHLVYKDMHPLIHELEMAVSDGNREACRRILAEMRKEMML